MGKNKGVWMKAFCPDAKCLTEEEIASLSEDEKKTAQGKEGLWLSVFCPDEACLTDPETGKEVKVGVNTIGDKGIWLTLFCPGESCVTEDPVRLV